MMSVRQLGQIRFTAVLVLGEVDHAQDREATWAAVNDLVAAIDIS